MDRQELADRLARWAHWAEATTPQLIQVGHALEDDLRAAASIIRGDEGWIHDGYEGEVLVDGDWVAGAGAEGLCDVEREVNHYAAQYASEGVVTTAIWERSKRPVSKPVVGGGLGEGDGSSSASLPADPNGPTAAQSPAGGRG